MGLNQCLFWGRLFGILACVCLVYVTVLCQLICKSTWPHLCLSGYWMCIIFHIFMHVDLCFSLGIISLMMIHLRQLNYLQEEEEKEEEEQARMKDSTRVEEDIALKQMSIATARGAQEQARARAQEKQQQLCELSRALAVLASASVRLHPKTFYFFIYSESDSTDYY